MKPGRPKKLTLDFFIHDVHASSDIKIRRLEKRHGNDGYATFFKLLERMCQHDGMKLDLSDTGNAEILADDFNLRDIHHLFQVIQDCTEIGLFDKQLWNGDRVVFSHSLYGRYLDRLEERRQAAERKNRRAEAKNLATRIKDIQESEAGIITRENPIITRENTGGSRDISPDIRTQITEPRIERENIPDEKPSLSSHPIQRMEERFRSGGGDYYLRRYHPNLAGSGLEWIYNGPGANDFAPEVVKAAIAHLEKYKLPHTEADGKQYIRNCIFNRKWADLEARVEEFRAPVEEKAPEPEKELGWWETPEFAPVWGQVKAIAAKHGVFVKPCAERFARTKFRYKFHPNHPEDYFPETVTAGRMQGVWLQQFEGRLIRLKREYESRYRPWEECPVREEALAGWA